jgi:hypothetical protein
VVTNFKQQPIPQAVSDEWARHMPGAPPPRLFTTDDGLRALIAREPCGGRPDDPLRWHISISHERRVPTWVEIRDACHQLRPGVMFSVGVQPLSMWMNEHEFVLHAWETVDDALFEDARANARGDKPT